MSPEPRDPASRPGRRTLLRTAAGTAAVTVTGGLGAAPAAARGLPRAPRRRRSAAPLPVAGTTVVWWSSDGPADPASDPVAFAAAELARYLERITGRPLPRHRADRPGRGVALLPASAAPVEQGVPAALAAAGDTLLAGRGEEAHAVVVGPAGALAAGRGPRAVLYAVYALLERAGVRFFAPAFPSYQGRAERVPRDPALVLSGTHGTVEEPAWTWRRKYVEEGTSHTAEGLVLLLDWMAKNRLNTLVHPSDYNHWSVITWDRVRTAVAPEAARRGIVVEVGGHGYESFLPRERYPAYYTGGANVFDVHNPDALDAYVRAVVAHLAARPEITVFDCWPPDTATWPAAAVTAFGTVANAEAHVVNTLRAALATALPGVRVERIAYGAAIAPPTPGRGFHPEVLIDFAPYERTYQHAVDDPASGTNAPLAALLRSWSEAAEGPLAVYDYNRRYRWRSLPVRPLGILAADARFYASLGIDGLGSYAEPADWLPFEAVHLFSARLARDPGTDPDHWLAGYLADRFGPAAGHLADYYARTTADPDGFTVPAYASAAETGYRAAAAALDRALAVLAGREEYPVAALLRSHIDLALADVAITTAPTAAARTTARAAYRTLLEEHRFRGLVLQDIRSVQRWGGTLAHRDGHAVYRLPAHAAPVESGLTVARGGSATVRLRAQDVDWRGHTVTWNATAPAGLVPGTVSGTLTPAGAADAVHRLVLTASASLTPGSRTVTFAFRTEDGTVLPPARLTVTVV
ncbi:DUF4838 domain-containing protein [Streptomyces tsukubensis]|uniref:DUF4838 domain-containing protein n=1 Tax=Streptomyces tsukubensis TaxID=83656 RepID=UPI00344EB711